MLLSPDQRFTCARCGRCCRRATVPVTLAEAEAYRAAGAGRWFSEGGGSAAVDPFEPIPEHPSLLQIRKREDGACGFLSEEGLCRIHEELGADRKPIACRVFPFRFHPVEQDVVVTASFACPTVVANDGALLSSQSRDISALYADWKHEFPETAARVEFVAGRALPPAVLTKLRSVLVRMLDTPAADGSFDLAASLRRVAAFVDDLSRRRVVALADADFTQYFEVMSRHALSQTPPPRRVSLLTRTLFRGFLLAAISVQLHLHPRFRRKTGAIRVALTRLLLHLHGVGPGAAGFDLGAARAVALDVNDDAIRELATHYLRSAFETLGTGRRPIVDEIAVAAAHVNTACVLARMHAARHGKASVDAGSFAQGVLESADLTQADSGGIFSRLLTSCAAGLDALHLFPPFAS